MPPPERTEFKSVAYELFILLISVLSLVNLAIAALSLFTVRINSQASAVVLVMDVAIAPVLAADFIYRLATAKSRRRYLFRGLGWLDLLAIVPGFRILRIVRIGQVVHWMRRTGRWQVTEQLAEQRAVATFLFTIFLVFVVVEASAATIFTAESASPDANIKTAGDAIWWGLVTITTVGYGDRVPVTPEGRVIGVFLLFSGIALFSVLTGFIANVFLAPRRARRRYARTPDPSQTIAILRDLLADQDERSRLILERLDELEASLKPANKP